MKALDKSYHQCRLPINIICLTCFLSIVSSQRLNHNIPVSRGSENIWSYKAQISMASFGVIYNTLCLSLMFSLNDSSKMSFYPINVGLNTIDLLFSLTRLIPSILAYAHGELYGGDIGCYLESLINFVLGTWSVWAIVGMAWVARNDLCNKTKITNKQMVIYLAITFVLVFTVVIISMEIPYGGYYVTESGTYCLLKISSYVGGPVTLLFGWIIPVVFLMYNLLLTYESVMRAQAVLERLDVKELAKGRYIYMVLKMGYFLATTVTFYSPMFFLAVYEWSTNRYVNALYGGFTGLSCVFVEGVLNPSLFFYLNADLRDKFWELIGIHVATMLQFVGVFKCLEFILGRRVRFNSRRIKTIAVHRRTSSNNDSSSLKGSSQVTSNKLLPNDIFDAAYKLKANEGKLRVVIPLITSRNDELDYTDITTWLNDATLFESFKEHGRKEYTTENFLFYNDVRKYYFQGREFLDDLGEYIDDQEEDLSELPEYLKKSWNELEALGNRIYTLYIEVPNAPLEINIPADVRAPINQIFTHSNKPVTHNQLNRRKSFLGGQVKTLPEETIDEITKFPSLHIINGAEYSMIAVAEKYVHIFDNSVGIIRGIIETDIWPRFKKSTLFRTAKFEHKRAQGQGSSKI